MKAVALLLLIATNAIGAPGAHGPNGEHLDAPTTSTPNGLMRLADGSVNVPMLAQRRLGMRTVIATESEAAATVELAARVLMDPNAGGRVQTVVGGKIQPGPRGLPVAGQSVRRGEVLGYVVHHAEPIAVANQQAQLAEIRSSRKLAEQRVERLQMLEGTVPRKDIEAAKADLESLTGREKAVGTGIGAREPLISPIAGVIARADIVAGQVVESRDVLFEIIDPARVLVEATTSDPKIANRLGGAALKDTEGVQLQWLGAARSLRDGVLPITFLAKAVPANQPLPLAIGQPVTVIGSLKETVKGYVLPAQAITRNAANESVVWIKAGAERYVPQPVRYQALDAQRAVVTSGLGTDNRVVVEGAALIAQIR